MHAQLSVYVPLVFTIVANNGIMVIPSLPHGSNIYTDEKLSIKELGPYTGTSTLLASCSTQQHNTEHHSIHRWRCVYLYSYIHEEKTSYAIEITK